MPASSYHFFSSRAISKLDAPFHLSMPTSSDGSEIIVRSLAAGVRDRRPTPEPSVNCAPCGMLATKSAHAIDCALGELRVHLLRLVGRQRRRVRVLIVCSRGATRIVRCCRLLSRHFSSGCARARARVADTRDAR